MVHASGVCRVFIELSQHYSYRIWKLEAQSCVQQRPNVTRSRTWVVIGRRRRVASRRNYRRSSYGEQRSRVWERSHLPRQQSPPPPPTPSRSDQLPLWSSSAPAQSAPSCMQLNPAPVPSEQCHRINAQVTSYFRDVGIISTSSTFLLLQNQPVIYI